QRNAGHRDEGDLPCYDGGPHHRVGVHGLPDPLDGLRHELTDRMVLFHGLLPLSFPGRRWPPPGVVFYGSKWLSSPPTPRGGRWPAAGPPSATGPPGG